MNKFNYIIVEEGILWLISSSNNKKIFWDIGSFRPDLESKLKKNVKYKVNVLTDEENLPNGKLINFPRTITIYNGTSKKTFVNVR